MNSVWFENSTQDNNVGQWAGDPGYNISSREVWGRYANPSAPSGATSIEHFVPYPHEYSRNKPHRPWYPGRPRHSEPYPNLPYNPHQYGSHIVYESSYPWYGQVINNTITAPSNVIPWPVNREGFSNNNPYAQLKSMGVYAEEYEHQLN